MASLRYIVTEPPSFKELRLYVLHTLLFAEQGLGEDVITVEAQLLEADELAAERGDAPNKKFHFAVDLLSPSAANWYVTVQDDSNNWIQLIGDQKTDRVTFELLT